MNNIKGYDKFFSINEKAGSSDEKENPKLGAKPAVTFPTEKVLSPACKKIVSAFKSFGEVECSVDKAGKHNVSITCGENCNIAKFNKITSKIAEVCKENKFKDSVNDCKLVSKNGKVTFSLVPKNI
jgi:hypothetical protein